MTLFFKGVWAFGQLKGTCCGDGVMCHAGERKVAFGMTAEQGKVMPEREKWLLA